MRSLHANIQNALDDAYVLPVMFTELVFDDGTLRLHTDLGDITWGGHTWLGVGDLGSIDAIEERDDLSPTGTLLRLSGLNTTVLTEALTQNYFDRPANIYFGLRDTVTASLVSDPYELFPGRMDQMKITIGDVQNIIEMAVENELIEFQDPRMQYYSDAELQRDYPGSLGFKWLAAMIDTKILWHGDSYVVFGTHDVVSKPRNQHSEKHGLIDKFISPGFGSGLGQD